LSILSKSCKKEKYRFIGEGMALKIRIGGMDMPDGYKQIETQPTQIGRELFNLT
jgi:hypothetical protein